MEAKQVLAEIKAFIATEILQGADQGLDHATPLLELRILDSISVTALITFIEERFGIEVPEDMLVPEYFADLRSVTELVTQLSPGPAARSA